MATPIGGLTPNLIDAFTDTCLNNPWIGAGLVGLSHLVPAVYQKIRTGLTKTKYGMTNEKKYYRKGKLNRRSKFKRYKWINNYYRYKLDYVANLSVQANVNYINIKIVGQANGSNTQIDALSYASSIDHFNDLIKSFNEMKICGIAIQYKPYQITKVDPDQSVGNKAPNILFQVLTGIEDKQNPIATITGPTDENIQNMVDYPYSRLIAADDDFRMYRPFGFKKVLSGYSEQITDDILHSYVPTNTSVGESKIYIRTMLVPGYRNNRSSTWDLGSITITLYIRFRNSKI